MATQYPLEEGPTAAEAHARHMARRDGQLHGKPDPAAMLASVGALVFLMFLLAVGVIAGG